MATESGHFCRLEQLGFVHVTGADAASFLHGQLSRTVGETPEGLAPLAAWHNSKGRVLALVRVLRLDDGWVLATPAAIVEPLLAGLARFVLRSKVTLSDAGTEWRAAAVLGAGSDWLERHAPGLGPQPPASVSHGGLEWVRLGPALVHVFGPAAQVDPLATELAPATPAEASLAEIRLGLPEIMPVTAERYLPQMLNLDLLGGVSFDKGCYPGQEVIARTQNLGAVKRRLRRFGAHDTGLPAAGSEIHDERGQSAGEVLRAAPADDRIELLAIAPLGERPLYLDASQRVRLEPLGLPYRLPA